MTKLVPVLFICALFAVIPPAMYAQKLQVAAYYPEWGVEHQRYLAKDLRENGAANKLTVLLYAFSEPGPDSAGNIEPNFKNAYEAYQQVYSDSMSVDGVADDSTQPLRGQFNHIRELKERYPNLKVLISIGGWSGSAYFSDAFLTPQSREKFADAIIGRYILGNLPVQNGAGGKGAAVGLFDGIDIDWEYPLGGGMPGNHYNVNDRNNLTDFYALMRAKLDSINPKLMLTAAVPSSENNASHYNIKADEKYLNWYNLMTYDYAGEWSGVTNHHANLLASPEDTSAVPQSFDSSVRYYIDSLGVDSRKIVPGAAFYGHGWTGVAPADFGLYQLAGGPVSNTAQGGSSLYSYISTLASKRFVYHWDTLAMAPSLYNPTDSVFWSYDDAKSISLKYHYVRAYNLGGLMCWEISGDDSAGTLVTAMATGKMPGGAVVHRPAGKSRPRIKVVTPGRSADFKAGSNVIINTVVSDEGGKIVRVGFYVDGKSIGYDTIAPFDWVWFNITRGKHEIRAVGMDNNGAVASASVVVSVKSSSPGKGR